MALPQLIKINSGNLLGRLNVDYDKATDTINGGLSIVDLRTGKVTASRMIEVPIGKIRDAIIAIQASKSPRTPSELAGDLSIHIDHSGHLSGDAFAMAGFWSDVKKRANSIAKRVGSKKLLRMAKRVMNDPRFAKGLAMASMIYPPLGMTVAQIQNATKLVHAASARDPKAIAKIAAIAEAAKGGDTAAQKVAAGMIVLKKTIDAGNDPMAEVGAWLTRKQATLEQTGFNPTHKHPLRQLYLAAVNR